MDTVKYCAAYPSPIGTLFIAEKDGAVTDLTTARPGGATESETPLLAEIKRQLDEYFAGARRDFNVPMSPGGTEFQRRVWERLRAIPYGETRTYGQIARDIGDANASRAVGRANGGNPIWILIPCHRVIGADGSLTGYAGGIELKKYLLGLEEIKPQERA